MTYHYSPIEAAALYVQMYSSNDSGASPTAACAASTAAHAASTVSGGLPVTAAHAASTNHS